MKLLYDNPDELIEVSDTPESKGESKEKQNYITKKTQDKVRNKVREKAYIEPNPLHSKGESNRIRVIRLLSDNGNLTLPEIADKLQLSLGGVEKIVRQLKKEGILSREGSTKAGKWIVKLED